MGGKKDAGGRVPLSGNSKTLFEFKPLAEGRPAGPSAKLDSLYARAANLSFKDLLFHRPDYDADGP
jgi:hypothetical protein